MPKTLADMTTEQREKCLGMWCDVATPFGTELSIYDQSRWTQEPTLFDPGYGHFDADLSKVTPRFDLPRVWNPDGTPVDGEWLPAGTHTRVIPKNRRAYVTMSEENPQPEVMEP